jgi:hypothetical protein
MMSGGYRFPGWWNNLYFSEKSIECLQILKTVCEFACGLGQKYVAHASFPTMME